MTKKNLKFEEYLNKQFDKTTIGASSRKSYISILKNVRKALQYEGCSLFFVKDTTKVIDIVKNKSKSYKISLYSAIVKISKHKVSNKIYGDLISSLNQERVDILKQGDMNSKEKASIGGLKFEDLLKILPLINEDMSLNRGDDKKFYYSYQYYILSLLYLKCEFLPRLDYSSVKVIYNEDKLIPYDCDCIDNNVNQMLVLDYKISVHFNTFKNIKKTGPMSFDLCNDVREEVSEWLMFKDNLEKEHLFYNLSCEKPYNNKRFSELLKRMFLKYLDRSIGANDIRKLKEKHLQSSPEYQKLTLKQKETLHKNNFHSKGIAELCYNKTEDLPSDTEEI